MKKKLDIDELMAETWLMVVQLRHGVPALQGEALYQHCQLQVEKVQEQLQIAGYGHESIEHITYAQCALLDETVLGRQGENQEQDSGYQVWMKAPLQARFFNSLQAGEALYERIRSVLHQTAPDIAVLTCFHRVLQLGFQGQYGLQAIAPEQRTQTMAELSSRVPSFSAKPNGLLKRAKGRRGSRWLRSLWFWSFIVVLVVAGLWWGGHHYLQSLLAEQLQGLH
ncbi:type VI secretion system protein TssL, short form [Xenorhabdus szentirmaii]|uniref:type VI secretion system protein TssL, short form n=1 Tax=Xenorhabdus szentirmaii TaxID=290112 RepID=UPI0032B7B6DA